MAWNEKEKRGRKSAESINQVVLNRFCMEGREKTKPCGRSTQTGKGERKKTIRTSGAVRRHTGPLSGGGEGGGSNEASHNPEGLTKFGE